MKIFFIEFFFRLANFLYRKIYILKAIFLCEKINTSNCPLSYWKQFILPGGFWVIENLKTKKIVGTCFAATDPNDREESIGSLEWLASDPQHKNLGIGSILASKISSRLIEENFKKLRLGTHANNNTVIRLYKKLGWKTENEI